MTVATKQMRSIGKRGTGTTSNRQSPAAGADSSASQDASCFHCGLPVAASSAPPSLEVLGVQRYFCCPGCHAGRSNVSGRGGFLRVSQTKTLAVALGFRATVRLPVTSRRRSTSLRRRRYWTVCKAGGTAAGRVYYGYGNSGEVDPCGVPLTILPGAPA